MRLRAKSIRRIASPALLEILLVEMLLVGILLGAVTGMNAAPLQKERTFRASQNPRVIIDNPASGRLVIQGWDRPEVRAKVVSSSPGVSVEMRKLPREGPADRVYIVVRPGAGNSSHPGKAKADLLIEIPAEVELEVRQQAGPVNAEGFYGDIKIETVSGNVTVTDVGGHLALKSMSGELHLIRPSGSVEAETISGDISFIWPAKRKGIRADHAGPDYLRGRLSAPRPLRLSKPQRQHRSRLHRSQLFYSGGPHRPGKGGEGPFDADDSARTAPVGNSSHHLYNDCGQPAGRQRLRADEQLQRNDSGPLAAIRDAPKKFPPLCSSSLDFSAPNSYNKARRVGVYL